MAQAVVVREGGFGWLHSSSGDYDDWIRIIQRNTDNCIVVDTSKEARKLAENNATNCVIFVTQGMLHTARTLKKDFPHLKVILLTGFQTWHERTDVVIVDKARFDVKNWRELVKN